MDEKDNKPKEEETIKVPLSALTKLQEDLARMEQKLEDEAGKRAGLEEQFASQVKTDAEPALKMKKTFEPKFRTVRIRKYPIAGDPENLGYIIGWTSRGAYQQIDRSGLTPQVVDFIDVVFLGHEKTPEGKIKAEKIRLLDLYNNGVQIHCKILSTQKDEKIVPTGEEIEVASYDAQHGLVSTGEKIDGFVTFSDIKYTIQIPGVEQSVVIDSMFVN